MKTGGLDRAGEWARGTVSAGVLTLALAGTCLPALAQAVYNFDVPRGDLADVVTLIARAAGTPIVFPAGLARGYTAGPIRGRESVEAALAQALTGTGLQVARGAGGSLTIRAAAGGAPGVPAGADLEAIDVTDAGGIPGGSHGDEGFQQGDAGDTIRIGDATAREIPISVTAVTQKVLESQVVTTATDAVQNVAGVNLSSSGNGIGRPSFTIRGFANAGYTVNGMPNGGPYDQIPVDAVERVEVLKGPTSILNGLSDQGGLVNIALKQPTDQTIRNLTLRYGSYNYTTIATDLGGRVEGLEGTTFRFVASGNHADQNFAGYRDPHEILVAPSLRWQGQDLMLEGGLRYTQARIVPDAYAFVVPLLSGELGPLVTPRRGIPIGNPSFGGTTENLTLYTKQSYDIGRIFGLDVTLNNRLEYSKQNYSVRVTNLSPFPVSELSTTLPFVKSEFFENAHNFNDRVDLTAKYETDYAKQTLKFGYDFLSYYYNDTINKDLNRDLFYTDITTGFPRTQTRINAIPPDSVSPTSNTTQGFYVIDKVDTLDDRLHILGSVRYDKFHQKTSTNDSLYGFSSASSDTGGLSWVAGAAFDVAKWMTVYGNRSNGYFPNFYKDPSGNLLPPEQRDLAEVGTRYYLFDKRLTLTTAFFDLARTNVAVIDPSDPTGRRAILVPAQNSKGMEIEAQGEVLPGLNLIASLTSQTFEAGQGNGNAGLFGRPKHLASLWATYTLQDTPLAGLTFGAGVRSIGSFLVTPDYLSAYRIAGYSTFDAALSYETPNYTVSLKVNNIANKYALLPTTSSTYIGVIQGRNVVLQATYRF